jgi:hypothetical protein
MYVAKTALTMTDLDINPVSQGMCTCIYAYISIYTRILKYTYIHTYMHTEGRNLLLDALQHAYIHTYIYTYMLKRRKDIGVVRVCNHVHTHTHIYIHTYTQRGTISS